MTGIEVLADFGKSVFSIINAPEGVAVGRWAFAVMFLISGSIKLRQPLLAAFAIADFGLTRHARRAYGLALGLVEAGLGIWLASGLGVAFGMWAAAILLAGFTGLIARALRAGGGFPCFCFGESDSLVSTKTLWRTAALTLVAFALVPGSTGLGATRAASPYEIVVGISLVGILLLASRIPTLFRWDPLRTRAS